MKFHLALFLSFLALSAEPAGLLRTWQGIPGIERTAKGRTFICWYSGGTHEPSPTNTVYLAHSDDNGKTFSTPTAIAGPLDGARAFDPTLWIDPSGKLWYIFNRGNKDAARHGVYARTCEKPDAKLLQWSPEFRIGFDEAPFAFRMNKPTVLSTGEWILPVTHSSEPSHEWFGSSKEVEGAGISTDRGKTWTLHGSVQAPAWTLENMIVELRDGRLWMLTRTGGKVLWQSHSSDHGRTWSVGTPSSIASPGSRFFIRRLASGNLLLINHYQFTGRSHMTAQISTDDGKSWNEGLLLDERTGVSYPDAVQAKDGTIYAIYDRDRYGAGEILMAAFREKDVIARRNVSGKVRLKQIVQHLDPLGQAAASVPLLPPGWDPKAAADRVMQGLARVTAPEVKGAHDSEFTIAGDRAYVVGEVNEQQAGENPEWSYIYAMLSVVNLRTQAVEKIIPMARGGQVFDNETLPEGSCFVPRIIKKDDRTLRCYFASEAPGKRQSQTYYLDFDIASMSFERSVHRAKLQTAAGTFDMQPGPFHADAVANGFQHPAKDFGLYMIDAFKAFDGKLYVGMNNYAARQNALAVVHPDLATFEVIGHMIQPAELKLSETAVNRLPDGTWMAICRQEAGNLNYTFTTSKDGKTWTPNEYRPFVPNGTSSKPTFDRFFSTYYLGWQEATRINGVGRSVFNIDVSVDGVHWERKYRFETEKSFQYPSFHEYRGTVYLTVTQGDSSGSRKERILFGKLE